MPYTNPLSDHISNTLSASNALLIVIEDIEAAPARVAQLRAELASLQAQITNRRHSLQTERTEFDTWRRWRGDADDFEQTRREVEQRDHQAIVGELKAKIVATQNLMAAEHRKLEEIVKKIRKLELRWANPIAPPSQ
jgi:polyhydroxyalkanoate synthesis regulator phasin